MSFPSSTPHRGTSRVKRLSPWAWALERTTASAWVESQGWCRGPNTVPTSSVKKQISRDGTSTNRGPTQKICLKLDVSGQKDQKGSVFGSLQGFSSRDLRLPGASPIPATLCWKPGLRVQESAWCAPWSCGYAEAELPQSGCLPPFLPHR